MERSEWVAIVQQIRVNWPHAKVPDGSIAKWYADLQHLPAEQVSGLVESFYRDGDRYPPSGGQILARLASLEPDAREHWGRAWKLLKDALGKYDALGWLREQEPTAAAVLRQLGGNAFTFQNDDEPIVRAQFRQLYEAEIDRAHRSAVASQIPGIDEARGSQPRQIDVRKALPKSEPDPDSADQGEGE